MLGKDKSAASSDTLSVTERMQRQQPGDKGKISESRKMAAGSSLFTEPQSGIRIV